MFEGRLRHIEIAVDVGSEGAVPLLLRNFLQVFLVSLKGSVIYQNVQPSELFDHFVDRSATETWVGNIPGNQHSASAFGLNCALGLLCVRMLFSKVNDTNVSSFAGVKHRNSTTNS